MGVKVTLFLLTVSKGAINTIGTLLDGDFPSSILLAALLPPEPDDDDGFQIIVRVTCYICPDRRMYTISIFASILHSQDKNIAEKVLLLLITIIDYWPHGF